MQVSRFIVALLVFFTVVFPLAVKGSPDSLLAAKAKEFYLEAEKCRNIDAEKAIYFGEKAILASSRANDPSMEIRGHFLVGGLKENQNELAEAYGHFQNALHIASSINDLVQVANCYIFMGDVYKRLSMYRESVHYMEKGFELAKHIKDTSLIMNAADRLGHVNMDEGERSGQKKFYDNALWYYNYSLSLRQKRPNDRKQLSVGYINLANAYLVFVRHGADTANARVSVNYSLQGYEIAETNNLPHEKAIHLLNMGEAFLAAGDADKALFYFEKSLNIYRELDVRFWQSTVLRDIGMAYKAKKNYAEAIRRFEEANSISREFNIAEQAETYRMLSQLYEEQGIFEKAIVTLKKYQDLVNLEQNQNSTLELERMEMEFETQKKDREIRFLNKHERLLEEKLRNENILLWILVGTTLLILLVALLTYNRSRILRRSKEISDKARIMQEQFLANTSHEIRTPMNGIVGMADQLMKTPLTDQQKEYLQVIKKSSDHLLHIINDLLDLSKIKAGKMEFRESEFVLSTMFSELEAAFSTPAKEKNLHLRAEIDPRLPSVLNGDSLRLKQILINLLDNAIKFTEQGSVMLTAKLNEQKADLCIIGFSVKDTGKGIPARNLGNVFESFVQVESAGKRKHGGTGLGLAISKLLIESQGGKISVKSEEEKGTEFEFFIPFKKGQIISLERGMKERKIDPRPKSLADKKILVIEDNAINQKVIESTLAGWNAQFLIVSTAVEGFDALAEEEFDVILMDIELPGISGIEATQYIRSKFRNKNKDIPIIALTAYAYESEKEKCLAAGINAVVVKPFLPEDLLAKIICSNGTSNAGPEISQPSSGDFSIEGLLKKYSERPRELEELLNLLITEIPGYVDELEERIESGDIKSIKAQVHKMKSPAGLLGAGKVIGILAEVENMAHSEKETLPQKLIALKKEVEILLAEISKFRSGHLHS